jgi:starvation-inducible outer membrane lipoprotein
MIQKLYFFIVCFLVCFSSGCAPILSQAVIDESDSISFQEAKRETVKHIGKVIILGGTIVNTVKTLKGIEWEVVQRSLGYDMKPLIGDSTTGRFIVQSDKALDVHLFKRGQKITFAAEIIGNETRPLDQTQYTYLVLRLKEYHLWPDAVRWYDQNFHFSFGVSSGY